MEHAAHVRAIFRAQRAIRRSVWPLLRSTVRFRMRRPLTLALTFVIALRLGGALCQAETPVRIRVLSDDTCLVHEVPILYRDVGAKLRELGTPSDANIHVNAENGAKYEAIASTFESLKRAGFKFKVGTVNVRIP
jgi:hypothetical protein